MSKQTLLEGGTDINRSPRSSKKSRDSDSESKTKASTSSMFASFLGKP